MVLGETLDLSNHEHIEDAFFHDYRSFESFWVLASITGEDERKDFIRVYADQFKELPPAGRLRLTADVTEFLAGMVDARKRLGF